MYYVIDGPVIKAVYESAKLVYLGKKKRNTAVKELVDQGLMNRSSATDTIYNLEHMLRGERYERTNNADTTEYFLDHIQEDFGLLALDNALSALEQHIHYYENLTGSRMLKLMGVLKKYREMEKAVEIPDEEMPSEEELVDYDSQFEEGQAKEITQIVRRRCGALIAKARAHYRSSDGELHCIACGWSRPTKLLRSDIVEIHHMHSVGSLPKKGIRQKFSEAIQCLVPLCPNCHRLTHSRPNGGTFTLDELKKMFKK